MTCCNVSLVPWYCHPESENTTSPPRAQINSCSVHPRVCACQLLSPRTESEILKWNAHQTCTVDVAPHRSSLQYQPYMELMASRLGTVPRCSVRPVDAARVMAIQTPLQRVFQIHRLLTAPQDLAIAGFGLARGSWPVARGSWLVARGSWLVARGSWLVARAVAHLLQGDFCAALPAAGWETIALAGRGSRRRRSLLVPWTLHG
jgi:hypothetical protein